MEKYTCIVVDDEILARELLAAHISKIPYFELKASCSNAIEAKLALQQQQPDILFLDINMPDLSGLELLRMLNKPPVTILTTAHAEYSLEGYELDVLDYLLKPIEFERFFKAATKAVEWIDRGKPGISTSGITTLTETANTYFFVKSDYKIVKVVFDEILFIEALQKYVRIHCSVGNIITLMSMSQLEEALPKEKFVRIHRSYIVNLDKINSIEGNMINIGTHQLTVSRGQKEEFQEWVQKKGLGL